MLAAQAGCPLSAQAGYFLCALPATTCASRPLAPCFTCASLTRLHGLQVDSLCSTRGDSESEAARRIKTQLMVEIQVHGLPVYLNGPAYILEWP